jgi:hypothetical protein
VSLPGYISTFFNTNRVYVRVSMLHASVRIAPHPNQFNAPNPIPCTRYPPPIIQRLPHQLPDHSYVSLYKSSETSSHNIYLQSCIPPRPHLTFIGPRSNTKSCPTLSCSLSPVLVATCTQTRRERDIRSRRGQRRIRNALDRRGDSSGEEGGGVQLACG